MLEFIVIMEVVKMVSDFIKKRLYDLRYIIDIFIIFLIRECYYFIDKTKNRITLILHFIICNFVFLCLEFLLLNFLLEL